MLSTSKTWRVASVCAAVLSLTLAGCDDPDPISPEEEALEELRNATAAFQDVEAARAAGYTVLVTHPTNGNRCLRDAQLGGMGFHYLNADLVDDAVAVDSPEVVIYEPKADGTLEFVGVEYIIPFAIRADDQPPPELFGKEFQQNYTFNLWALHAWAWKDNPSGTFASYNPAVTCEYADAVE